MKKCFKCGQLLDKSAFYKHKETADGLLGKCKECTKQDVQRNYQKTATKFAEYEKKRNGTEKRKAQRRQQEKKVREENGIKRACRLIYHAAVERGTLVKTPCIVCGETKVHGHHTDYNIPLQVEWLCLKHHLERHGKQQRLFT